MKTRHLIAMLLKASGGDISGKTKLQKELYFLSQRLGLDLGYRAHHYGPYSTDVDQALDELIGAGFVQVDEEVYGIDYYRGFEMKRYDYRLTESGEKLVEKLISEYSDVYSKVQEFAQKLKDIGDPDYLRLSLAAKFHYVQSRGSGRLSEDDIIKEASKFGWNVDVGCAVDILGKLKPA